MIAIKSPTTSARGSSKTSVACQACKCRKSKCSGGPGTCNACRKLQTKCIIDPSSDMRRRDAKYNSKAYKALFDAFVESTRTGDVQLSTALSLAMQAIDPTGQLAAIGRSYSQVPSLDVALPYTTKSAVEFVFKFGMPYLKRPRTTIMPLEPSAESDVVLSPASTGDSPGPPEDNDPCTSPAEFGNDSDSQGSSRLSKADMGADSLINFEDITSIWSKLAATGLASRIQENTLPGFAYDAYNVKTDDPLSNAITSFRDAARHMINSGYHISDVIGDSTPCLDAFFGYENDMNMTAWSWACQIANASSYRSTSFQLALVYIAGIQMRFFIAPSAETYDDLPQMLRPLPNQYTIPHVAGIDICHLPVLKDFLLSNLNDYKDVSLSKQSCNWPYSDQACLVYSDTARTSVTMSQAFIEHVRKLENYSVDSCILETVPQMACHVRG